MTGLNTKFIKGDSILLTITAKNLSDDSLIDLSDISDLRYALIRSDIPSAAIALTKTLSNGVTILPQEDETFGKFTVSISKTESGQLAGVYLSEVQITHVSGDVVTLRNQDLSPGNVEVLTEIIPTT